MLKTNTFSKFRKIAIGSTIYLAETIYLTTSNGAKQPEPVLSAIAMLKWQMKSNITSTLTSGDMTGVYTISINNQERMSPDDFRNLLIDSNFYSDHILEAVLDFESKYGTAPESISHVETIKILK